MGISGNIVLRDGLRALRRRLPPGWQLAEPTRAPVPLDAITQVMAPNRSTGVLGIEARLRLDPKDVSPLVDAIRSSTGFDAPVIVFSRFLSEATRGRLREREVGFLDLTGNCWIALSKPGLYIETSGASEDPERKERPARSLRGPKAGRIVRALVERKRPPGVRELAAATAIDPGYVSRVLAFLDSEALIKRVGRGRIDSVDWSALLRRWALDAPLDARGQLTTYLEPRGPRALVNRLADSKDRYAITGAFAATHLAPVAPPRLVTVWIRDAEDAAARLELRPADAGANVLLLEPCDDGVFEGAALREGVWYAAPSQVAADLLTSPGRGPAEAEELITWMRANEEAWRS